MHFQSEKKKSKSSKKKRRHSDETHSEAEDGHRAHKSRKTSTSAGDVVKEVPAPAKDVAPHPAPKSLSNVVPPREQEQVKKGEEPRKSSSSEGAHTVTTKSNGQSKSLTNHKSSKLGGIPTDPSKLVEILTKSLETEAAPTEVLSSDSEENAER